MQTNNLHYDPMTIYDFSSFSFAYDMSKFFMFAFICNTKIKQELLWKCIDEQTLYKAAREYLIKHRERVSKITEALVISQILTKQNP